MRESKTIPIIEAINSKKDEHEKKIDFEPPKKENKIVKIKGFQEKEKDIPISSILQENEEKNLERSDKKKSGSVFIRPKTTRLTNLLQDSDEETDHFKKSKEIDRKYKKTATLGATSKLNKFLNNDDDDEDEDLFVITLFNYYFFFFLNII